MADDDSYRSDRLKPQSISTILVQPHGLDERAVARDIPNRKANPGFARGIERNREMFRAEGREVRRGNNLAIHLLAVAGNNLDERKWECPLRIGRNRSLGGG